MTRPPSSRPRLGDLSPKVQHLRPRRKDPGPHDSAPAFALDQTGSAGLPTPVLADPGIVRAGLDASGHLAESLGRLSRDALIEAADMHQRWVRETGERLAALARPPERVEDLLHGIFGFVSAQGDLATHRFGRAAALAQRMQIETLTALMQAGRTLAEESATALQGRRGSSDRE